MTKEYLYTYIFCPDKGETPAEALNREFRMMNKDDVLPSDCGTITEKKKAKQ